MTRRKPVMVPIALVSLTLALSGCTVSRSQTSSTSSASSNASVSIASTGAALTASADGKEPPLGEKATPKDTAAFAAYWKRQGYTVTTNQQTLKPDGTIKTFHFAASRHRKGLNESGTITASITETPPPDMAALKAAQAAALQAAAKKAPALEGTSTAKDIAAYVAFYEKQGYTVTRNEQSYDAGGTLKVFHFAAKRGQGANQASVSADINGATQDVTTSENTRETTGS